MAADAGTSTDAELEQRLAEREKAEREQAELDAAKLEPGTCPVCKDALKVKSLPGPLESLARALKLVRRPALVCPECGLKTPWVASPVGWILSMALAGGLASSGMSSIFAAQRITDPGQQKMVFLGGALMFGLGLLVGYGVHGATSSKLVAQRILHRRRLRALGEEQRDEDEGGWFQENLEAVVVAIILALIIRHFVMEAFVIPTGSMAPTLLGDHFRVDCPNCGYHHPVAKKEGQFGKRPTDEVGLYCPLCEAKYDQVVRPTDVYGGHKILVNKFVYDLRPPRRYEVIVFKFPKEPWRNYIKRLVGLPGETIQVRNGDIYADGDLARKPDDVQDAVWIQVHDAAYVPERAKRAWKPAAEGSEPPQVWRFDPHGVKAEAHPEAVEGAPLTWLDFTRGVEDSYAYNTDRAGGSNQVADARVRARVTAEEGATVRLAIQEVARQDDGQEYERTIAGRFGAGRFSATSGAAQVALEVDGEAQQTAEARLVPGRPHELTLAYADERARLQIDGQTVLAWDDPFGGTAPTHSVRVRVGVEGAPVTFERLRIDRDIHYVRVPGRSDKDPSRAPVTVPGDSYFAMGDNSPNSEDGRRWGFVHEGHLIGRAFLVFWPIHPFEIQFIR